MVASGDRLPLVTDVPLVTGRCERFQPARNLPAEYFHGFTFSDPITNLMAGVSLCMSEVVAFNVERSRSLVSFLRRRQRQSS